MQRGKYLNIQRQNMQGVKMSQYLRREMSHPGLVAVGSGETAEQSRGKAGVSR